MTPADRQQPASSFISKKSDAVERIPHITVCVCTFRRPKMLMRLLEGLAQQNTDGRFSHSVIVTDNDAAESARQVVEKYDHQALLPVLYSTEPRQNIALARNEALRHAAGEFIAFIDDDEFPASDWLLNMLVCCNKYSAAGVLGPVRPHFDEPPPDWILKGRFCDRPEHETGHVVHWNQARTGNVLFRRSIIGGTDQPFRSEFGTGGEDKDFFMRLMEGGHVFCWCNEAIVYETVPPERWTRRYMLRRALLRGENILKLAGQKRRLLAISLLALPVYTLLLPVAALGGQHTFMKYCIRWCDHAGRLLSAIGLNPVKAR